MTFANAKSVASGNYSIPPVGWPPPTHDAPGLAKFQRILDMMTRDPPTSPHNARTSKRRIGRDFYRIERMAKHLGDWARRFYFDPTEAMRAVIKSQSEHIAARGTTIEGYNHYFKPQTIREHDRVARLHAADEAFLSALLRAGLLIEAGHDTHEAVAWIMLQRQQWIRQLNAYKASPPQGDKYDRHLT